MYNLETCLTSVTILLKCTGLVYALSTNIILEVKIAILILRKKKKALGKNASKICCENESR